MVEMIQVIQVLQLIRDNQVRLARESTFELFTPSRPILISTKTKTLSLKNNPKIMCNMPKVAPILVTYIADFEFWTEFQLGIFFFGHLPATKGDIKTQNVVQTSP